ncbi:hypothetical protein ASE01_17700 [Nocardioides sp. Root190]|uniref:DUF2784 domain-containing protein n=1 Tax=Nocardioides sp. Root190 TaxID=1736488 RepID=UPI0006FA51CA|nr:DUF2784 domain-containing protein [Nocardioides sp. Root190]KRB73851.1 hypothetical protein ASE01_17700 [Nocardioides sp. Root190]
MHRIIAPFAVVIHLVFVGFTVIGGFLAWLVVPWLVVPHVAAAAWGGRMAVSRAACPLSRLENWGRSRTGRPELHERGFVAHYFEGTVYPHRWSRRIELVIGGLIAGSWLGFALR